MATFLVGIYHSGDPFSNEACGMSLVLPYVRRIVLMFPYYYYAKASRSAAGKSKEGTSVRTSSRTAHRACSWYNDCKSVPSTFHHTGQIAKESNSYIFSLLKLHTVFCECLQ